MSDSKLDQIVKGAPPPNVSPTQVAQSAKASPLPGSVTAPHLPPGYGSSGHDDPRDTLPSSPPQIYLNLLILESSLRLQYLSLRARLRLHLLLLTVLSGWILTFTYLLYFRPREDGSGVGGSVYWVLETSYKLAWIGGVVTACLLYATGMYERGVRWPRKFVGHTNRGLRQFNLKVVVVRGSLLSEVASWLHAGWWGESKRVDFQVLPKDVEIGAPKEHWNAHAARHGLVEEDIAPAGDVVRLLLLPKPFSPDFREGWDTYRLDYWEKENSRRAELRRLVKARKHEVARREGGWLWWTGWRGWKNVKLGLRGKTRRQAELEKLALKERPSAERMREKRRRETLLRPESHSRSSSRSSTPGPDPESRHSRHTSDSRITEERRLRRGSSASSNVATARAQKKPPAPTSRLSATETILEGQNGRPPTVIKKASALSMNSTGSEGSRKESPPPSPKVSAAVVEEIKAEPSEIR